MIDTATLNQCPPRLQLNFTPDKATISLSSLFASGKDAADLCVRFQKDYAACVLDAITAARSRFLKGPTWSHVETLREKLSHAEQAWFKRGPFQVTVRTFPDLAGTDRLATWRRR